MLIIPYCFLFYSFLLCFPFPCWLPDALSFLFPFVLTYIFLFFLLLSFFLLIIPYCFFSYIYRLCFPPLINFPLPSLPYLSPFVSYVTSLTHPLLTYYYRFFLYICLGVVMLSTPPLWKSWNLYKWCGDSFTCDAIVCITSTL